MIIYQQMALSPSGVSVNRINQIFILKKITPSFFTLILFTCSKCGLAHASDLSLSLSLFAPHFRRKSKWIFWDEKQGPIDEGSPSMSSSIFAIFHFEENVPVPCTTPVPSSLHGVSIIIAVFHVIASKRKIVIQFVWSGRNRATRPSEWSHRGFARAWPFNHHKFRGETANRPLSYRPLCSLDPWDRFQRAPPWPPSFEPRFHFGWTFFRFVVSASRKPSNGVFSLSLFLSLCEYLYIYFSNHYFLEERMIPVF